jgi:hypothetical protein
MQNISAPVTEAATTFKSYSSFEGYKEYSYIFYIPIYEGAPNTSTYTTPSEIIAKVGYKEKNDYLSGIKIGTSQNDFVSKIKNVNSNATVTIEKNTNNKTNILATGDKITIKVGDTSKTYTVVIYGDVNGDGSIKATDYVKIKNHIMGTNSLSGAYQVAADVNKDGSIKATDYVFVKNHIMGSYTISQ